jgi:hypothetical protein
MYFAEKLFPNLLLQSAVVVDNVNKTAEKGTTVNKVLKKTMQEWLMMHNISYEDMLKKRFNGHNKW